MIIEFDGKKPKIDESCFIAPNSTLIGDIIISENTLIFYGAICRADINRIFIGPASCIQENVVVHPHPDEPVTIEGESIVGYGSIIHGGTIKKGAFIGAGSIILHDVVIGAGSIVAADSMVIAGTKVPPGCLVAGKPCKVIREVEDSDLEWTRRAVNGYQNLLPEYRKTTA